MLKVGCLRTWDFCLYHKSELLSGTVTIEIHITPGIKARLRVQQ